MAENKHIINALPLIADALGRKYGVKVTISGTRAYTDGKNIHIPSLPLSADANVLNLARGYLDHEAAHLRITDFAALQTAHLTDIEKHVWNIIEDYMVEQKLAEIYPGCKQNFTWLIRHLFLKGDTIQKTDNDLDVNNIFNWVLVSLRAISVPELVCECDRLGHLLDRDFPGLRDDLQRLLQTIPTSCRNTNSCIDMAKNIVAKLKNYSNKEVSADDNAICEGEIKAQGQQIGSENSEKGICSTAPEKADNGFDREDSSFQSEVGGENNINAQPLNPPKEALNAVLNDASGLDTQDIGDLAGRILDGIYKVGNKNKITVATPKPYNGKPFSNTEINEIRQKSIALRTRLSALLQAKILARNHICHTGKVVRNRIARLSVGNTRIFARRDQKQGINTAVHILLDASSSMRNGNKSILASQACFAIADALYNVPGIGVAVSVFPCGYCNAAGESEPSWATVASVLAHKQKMHNRFQISDLGGTPMAEALWWVLQQMYLLQENRKILLIISDGEPDNMVEAQNAIFAYHRNNIEVYGLGIQTQAMSRLLSEKNSHAIYNLSQLTGGVFKLLQNRLLYPWRDSK